MLTRLCTLSGLPPLGAGAFCQLAALVPLGPIVGKRSLTSLGDHHPNDGKPPRTSGYRSRLDSGQPIAREPVQQGIGEAMGQHVRHRAAMLRVGE
jgi:hypothetical protein